ncbi:hypothetical protein BXZ70DRAFT_1068335 [Cristinia sonorae]|uniref:Uncharacterized protein n=1 Tax=Cristinia sonorae TaxID=1940300 RepID=A0A8K0UFA1_9AGAR|nr:hypothetical protein BXZ70DRAFT_1068335 [Cristinia sonorae]
MAQYKAEVEAHRTEAVAEKVLDRMREPMEMVESGVKAFLRSISGPSAQVASSSSDAPPSRAPSPPTIDWNLVPAETAQLAAPTEDISIQQLADALYDFLDEEASSEDEEIEREDTEEVEIPEPVVSVSDGDSHGNADVASITRARLRDEAELSRRWYPWVDKITCTLDILMHLPRSVFSQRQLDLFLWLLKVNGVDYVPSVKSMQELNAKLQRMCGIDTIAYQGALGHTYHVNDLRQIIAQEMANPRVRQHLHFYPEDAQGVKLTEGCQDARWLNEMPEDLLTPMARLRNRDYFIYEPAMLDNGQVCMPVRWFTREKDGKHELYAKCWQMGIVNNDMDSGWRVVKTNDLEIHHARFLKPLPLLQDDYKRFNIPDPAKLVDVLDSATGEYTAWDLTNPVLGNKWCARAKGHRVVGFGLWYYCDDTSGNMSKKWNKHNSVLVTAAGLPRIEAQKEYNVHFLCTSNIAPLLEMMDGIVEQLEQAQDEGIWVWDCLLNEPVLVIPFVLALLGDNPMQSEFACHIGLRGKFFCRNCWVKGRDAADAESTPAAPVNKDQHDDAASEHSSSPSSSEESTQSNHTETSGAPGKRGRRKKALESMSSMVNRVKAFLNIGKPRKKAETVKQLRSYFTQASTVDTKSTVAKMRTESGIKDTYQLFYLDKLFSSYKGKRQHERKTALDKLAKTMDPDKTMSPVWRIKGLDPHSDTPVEILHVVLLGFVKYLWRDVIQNQLKSQDQKKATLAARLTSFDVSGLGISPLAGQTLVQYAGSLTGRDFWAIAQAAPFVLYDLVPQDCFSTWVALSKLIPLIWQPEIHDVKHHLALLEKEINHFLVCAARWTVRWFNKPKFHILLHLPEHIQRFGPAIIFATEAFESFNAVIRAKSAHSNRQAPSRDIARAFAQSNCIRLILSGGLFIDISVQTPHADSSLPPHFSFKLQDWKRAGPGPFGLVQSPNTVTQYLGLESNIPRDSAKRGYCVADRKPARRFDALLAARVLSQEKRWDGHNSQLFKTANELHLDNGDKCSVGSSFAIFRDLTRAGATAVGRIEEVLLVQGSPEAMSLRPSYILIQEADISTAADGYQMPAVKLNHIYSVRLLEDILCTVNVQHNCAAHQCDLSGQRPIFQERVRTQQTQAAISHSVPTDLVLNTAQMRDAALLQPFRIDSPVLDTEAIIMASVAREIKVQSATRKHISAGPSKPPRSASLRVATLQRESQMDTLSNHRRDIGLGGSSVRGESSQRIVRWIDESGSYGGD